MRGSAYEGPHRSPRSVNSVVKRIWAREGTSSLGLDDVDVSILRLLRANGRITQEALANSVNLSRSAVHDRLRRLEDRHVIRGYRALVEWSALGLPHSALIWMRTAPAAACGPIEQAMLRIRAEDAIVDECHRVTGEWNLAAEVHTASASALQALADRVGRITGVQQTMTQIVLSSVSSQTEDLNR